MRRLGGAFIVMGKPKFVPMGLPRVLPPPVGLGLGRGREGEAFCAASGGCCGAPFSGVCGCVLPAQRDPFRKYPHKKKEKPLAKIVKEKSKSLTGDSQQSAQQGGELLGRHAS